MLRDDAKARQWWFDGDRKEECVQYDLGHMYYTGSMGVTRDYAEARKWFDKSTQNHPAAWYYLGYMYEYGLGVAKDISGAIRNYRAGAEGGNEQAKKALNRLTGKT